MACIKGVNRSATVALAPDAPYMAAGTMAGAVDLSFSSSASLEIFRLDFQSDDRDLPIVGEYPTSERFNRLSWARPTDAGSDKFGLGIIAGGLSDGSIDLWNPLSLIRSEKNENALVGHLSKHRGPVRGLEFNVIAPNLLASGADDGEICIWDLANPSEPSQFPPLKGNAAASQDEISFLSWNSKVQHILASTSYNGTTVVWDLKKQKPVISFSDSVRRRCSVLQWNPDVATQLVVASDEDGSPALRLWDMRNTMTPIREFVGHTKGVIAMSWCPNYSSYLLTCAKDNRTICWDTNSGEIVCELPASTHCNFDIHWYPKIPGVISASSFDGKIGVYNIEGCSRYGAGEADFGAGGYLKAPKWYKRPVGVTFGFGGKLVSFNTKSVGNAPSSSEVFIHKVVTESSLMSRSSEFEAAIQNGERNLLRTLCDKKSEEAASEEERETWGLLKVMFEDDGTARSKLLTHLGFTIPEPEKTEVEDDLSKVVNDLVIEETTTENVGLGEGDNLAFDNGVDFFNTLHSPKADTPLATSSSDKFADGTVSIADQVPQESDEIEESSDPSFDESVQHALVVGDYKGAVDKCISANKMADALVIAHAGGDSLWQSTRDQYLKNSRSPYLKVVAAMVTNDLLSLVNTRPLKFWKETLALLCSFASREQWTVLCDALASKLITAGNTLAAIICYICAGNIDKTVEIWSRNLSVEHDGKSYVDRLQDLMEKTVVLALASGQKQFSASLLQLVEKYTEILAAQGLLSTATEFLKLFSSAEATPELEILRQRIALCAESEKVVEPIAPSEPSPYQPNVPAYAYPDSNGQHIDSHYDRGYAAPISQPGYSTGLPQHPGYSTVQPQIPGYGAGQPQQYSTGQPQPPAYSTGQPPLQPGYGSIAPRPGFTPTPPRAPMFVPHQAPQIPVDNYGVQPAPSQPPPSTFVPSTPPPIRNLEQYQNPTPTLGSQLYPGSTNPGFQPIAPRPPQAMPGSGPNPQFNAAPYPRRDFGQPSSQVTPGPSTMQPPSPVHAAPVQPVASPAAPPPTVQTADTSNVPAHQKPVIVTLTRLFNETSEALGGARANPSKKREIEDNSKKIGALFAKLNSGDISRNAADKLVQLCQALDHGDFATALQIQVLLTTNEWDECNFWLATLKRMIKTKQSAR